MLRLSGTARGVRAAGEKLGGDRIETGHAFWQDLKEQQLPFFGGSTPLWRITLPAASAPLSLTGDWLLDWGGAQRWLRSDIPADTLRKTVAASNGHATLFRGGERTGEVFHPLQPPVLALHQRLKQSFDPHGIFNPGRMYAAL
jgi:glycolate oxidase FAD binding subunit